MAMANPATKAVPRRSTCRPTPRRPRIQIRIPEKTPANTIPITRPNLFMFEKSPTPGSWRSPRHRPPRLADDHPLAARTNAHSVASPITGQISSRSTRMLASGLFSRTSHSQAAYVSHSNAGSQKTLDLGSVRRTVARHAAHNARFAAATSSMCAGCCVSHPLRNSNMNSIGPFRSAGHPINPRRSRPPGSDSARSR